MTRTTRRSATPSAEFLDRAGRHRTSRSTSRTRRCRASFWLEAGKQGFLGLEIPEEYGGSGAGDFRFNAVLTEELAKVNAALPSCVGIHADIVAPYLVRPTAPRSRSSGGSRGFCTGEMHHRDRHDRALRRFGPRRAEDHRGPATATNGSSTARRRSSRTATPADMVITAVRTEPGEGGRRASRCSRSRRTRRASAAAASSTRSGRSESDTSELFFENVRCTDADIIGEVDHGFIHMMVSARPGAARLLGRQHRARQADPRGDDPVRQGPQGVRAADRRLPAQQVPARRAA